MPQQQQHAPRETFIALRARHQAYRIASEILYEAPIDVAKVFCTGCGRELYWRNQSIVDPLTCPDCGTHTPLPTYLRPYITPTCDPLYPEWFEDLRDDETLRYEPLLTWAEAEVDRAVPRWLWWFALFMLGVLVFGAFAAYRFATN